MAREIPIAEWGKDHWSTFAYAVCRATDHQGIVNPLRMRCKYYHSPHAPPEGYPTQLKNGAESGHDDYDCLVDLEREGFITDHGTGIRPVVRVTEKGLEAWTQLTAHKQAGGSFKTFEYRGQK